MLSPPCSNELLRDVAIVGQDRLPGDPPTVRNKEQNDRHDVLEVCQAFRAELAQVRSMTVIRDGFLALLPVEERRVHRPRTKGRDENAACAELLGRGPSQVLDWGLCSSVDGVKPGICNEKRRHDRADLAVVHQMLAGLAQEEEGRFALDIERAVILLLSDFDERLLEHQSGGVDGDVHPTELLDGLIKEPNAVGDLRETALNRECICTCGLHGRNGFVCGDSRRIAVVVDNHGLRARSSQCAGKLAAKVLDSARNYRHLAI